MAKSKKTSKSHNNITALSAKGSSSVMAESRGDEKKSSKKGLLKKAALGLTAAAMIGGVGAQAAKAATFTDLTKDALHDVGTAVHKSVISGLKMAVSPIALGKDLGSWAYQNPGKAMGVAAVAAAGTWACLSNVDLSSQDGPLTSLMKATKGSMDSYLEPAGQKIEEFFGGSKAYSQAKGSFDQLTSMMGQYVKSADEHVKNAASFIQTKNNDMWTVWDSMSKSAHAIKSVTHKNMADTVNTIHSKLNDFAKQCSAASPASGGSTGLVPKIFEQSKPLLETMSKAYTGSTGLVPKIFEQSKPLMETMSKAYTGSTGLVPKIFEQSKPLMETMSKAYTGSTGVVLKIFEQSKPLMEIMSKAFNIGK